MKESDEANGGQPSAQIRKGGGSFAGSVAVLGGGAVIAQALTVVSAPILSRLFLPEAFGISAAFTSLVTIVASLGCLSYNLAIVLPKDDDDAANLFGLCTVIVVAITGALLFCFGFWGSVILSWFRTPELLPCKWLLSVGFFAVVMGSLFRLWNTRHKRFGRLATVRVETAAASAGFCIGMGGTGFTSGVHLIVAHLLGTLVQPILLGYHFLRHDVSFVVRHCSFRGMREMAKRYRKFPLIISWSSLVSEGSKQIPTVLLLAFFGASVTGMYALARRMLMLPMNFIGEAVAQVFFQRAGAIRSEGGDLGWLLEALSQRLLTVGLIPTVVVIFSGPEVFRVFLGEQWVEAGLYASVLAAGILGAFVGAPLSQLFVIMERQGIALICNTLVLACRAGVLFFGGLVLRDILWTIALYSLVGFLFGAVQLVICVRLTHANGGAIARHTLRQLMYASPSAMLIFLAYSILGLSGWPVLIIAAVSTVPYGLLVLKHDDELKKLFQSALRRIPLLKR